LKTKLRKLPGMLWKALTDVPGWPDAPRSQRLRRSLPILLPLLGTALLLAWKFAYAAPRHREMIAAHGPLLRLEREVAGLNLTFSEQQVTDINSRERELAQALPQDMKAVRNMLRTVEQEASGLGWDATFSVVGGAEGTGKVVGAVEEIGVRVKLRPRTANAEPFATLLSMLDLLSAESRRIGLMRLMINADEGKWQTVEVGLRFTVPSLHAQAAQ
jgi:hypothetical protein